MKFDAFRFGGRINRAKFWRITVGIFFMNFFFHIWLAIQYGHGALNPQHGLTGHGWALVLLALFIFVISVWVSLATGVKRFHYRDKSGWWVLIPLVPVVGYLWYMIECGFLLGTPGPNRFGPDPLAAG